MKTTCKNPECGKTIHTFAVKLGFPGSGLKKHGHWFCSSKCYRSYLAGQMLEDRRCGLKKTVRRIKLGLLLLKNNFINQEQLNLALDEKSRSTAKLGQILVESGYITEKELKAVLSMQAGVAPITLDPLTKVKLKEDIPFKLVKEFHFIVFDVDIESKTILIAVYDMDYLSHLEEYLSRVYPGYLIKFYLEDREKIVAILSANYPGKSLGPEETGDTELDKTVVKCLAFLSQVSGSEVNVDNLENTVWLKAETADFNIDIYLTKRGRQVPHSRT